MNPVLVHGTGSIGERHLRVLKERLGLDAIARPVRPARAAEWRDRGYAVFVGAPDDRDPRPCPVIVATDTGRHLDDARESVRAGCDVLVEKPVTCNDQEAAQLADALATSGRRAFVAYGLRFHPGLTQFRAWLPRIGAVHAVRAQCQSYLPDWRPGRDHRDGFQARPREGGVLKDLSHEIDYCLWLFGVPQAVSAVIQNTGRLDMPVEEGVDLMWRADGDAIVTIRLDYLTRTTRRRLTAHGALGELTWDAIGGTVTYTPAVGEAETALTPVDRDEMFAAQTRAFLRACEGGDPEVLCTFEQARSVVRVMDAAYRSSASGSRELLA